MRLAHGWHVLVCMAILWASPATAAPQHVVSTFLCTDEYVFRLLPRERIAALSYLAADRHPVVSTIVESVRDYPLIHASAEEVLTRHPDLVVMYAGTETRLHAQLREVGVPILDVPWAQSLADIRRITANLGHALGGEQRATALLAAMDRNLAAAGAPHPPVRTLIYEPNGYVTAEGVTDDILARAGLANIAREMGATRRGTVPVEMVVARPPELLITSEPGRGGNSRAELVLHHPALSSLPPSVMVAPVSLTPLLCPGPWSAQMAPVFAALGEKARALARPHSGP